MKIWGVRSGLIGDTIMALPALTYLERKYPGSYKIWVIDKKCSQLAPIYMNHPLIDKIVITEDWVGLSKKDQELADSCDLVVDLYPQPTYPNWANDMNCIDQVMLMAGFHDYREYLSQEDLAPKLDKWFVNPSDIHPMNTAYARFMTEPKKDRKKTIGIMPFSNYGKTPGRHPSLAWWNQLCSLLHMYDLKHFGWITEPSITGAQKFTNLSFFEQIKMALECDLCLGTDSGSMWVIGAYQHPAIHMMTYHMPGHHKNSLALNPVNKNGYMAFNKNSCDAIDIYNLVERIKWII